MGNGGFPQQHRTACEKQVVKKQQQTQNPEVFSGAGDAWNVIRRRSCGNVMIFVTGAEKPERGHGSDVQEGGEQPAEWRPVCSLEQQGGIHTLYKRRGVERFIRVPT